MKFNEENLKEDISIKKLAEVSFISPFHMSRVFKHLTGYSPMEYVRYRRLTEAANLLSEGKQPVFSIGLDVGYDSPSAFSKAFKDRFQIVPKDCKQHFELLKDKFVKPIKKLENMKDLEKTNVSLSRIVENEKLTIVGLMGNQTNAEINAGKVSQLYNAIKNISMYALCQIIWQKSQENGGIYDIFQGFVVSAVEDLPDGLEVHDVNLNKCVILEKHVGDNSSFMDFASKVFGEWLPNSNYSHDTNDFTQIQFANWPEEDMSLSENQRRLCWEIWIPIK